MHRILYGSNEFGLKKLVWDIVAREYGGAAEEWDPIFDQFPEDV